MAPCSDGPVLPWWMEWLARSCSSAVPCWTALPRLPCSCPWMCACRCLCLAQLPWISRSGPCPSLLAAPVWSCFPKRVSSCALPRPILSGAILSRPSDSRTTKIASPFPPFLCYLPFSRYPHACSWQCVAAQLNIQKSLPLVVLISVLIFRRLWTTSNPRLRAPSSHF